MQLKLPLISSQVDINQGMRMKRKEDWPWHQLLMIKLIGSICSNKVNKQIIQLLCEKLFSKLIFIQQTWQEMEGIQKILYFDDYHAQTTAEGKMESLARLKNTLATLKKSKKYLSFPFTLGHLYHLVSQEKKMFEFRLHFKTSIERIKQLRTRIYEEVGFPFCHLKSYYQKLLVVSQDEMKKPEEVCSLIEKYKVKYIQIEGETSKKNVEKLNNMIYATNRKREFKRSWFLGNDLHNKFQGVVNPLLQPWVKSLSDTTAETKFTTKQAKEKLTQLKEASMKLKQFKFRKEVWSLPYNLAVKIWKLLNRHQIWEGGTLEGELNWSLLQKAQFFLKITYDKLGNIEKQIAHQLGPDKKTAGLLELMDGPISLFQKIFQSRDLVKQMKRLDYQKYAKKMKQLRTYEEGKNQSKNFRLHDEPLRLSDNELQILAFKTVMDEPEKNVQFEGIEDEEVSFRTDLYFVIREKGFQYCNKAYFHLLINDIENENKRLTKELEGVLGELRNLIPKVV